MKQGDLIAVNGKLYQYQGIEHKVYEVKIDDQGILASTSNPCYLTNIELSNRGIDLTENQWIGLTEHFIREEYKHLTEEAIKNISKDIVRGFVTTRTPLVEELSNYIAIYMIDKGGIKNEHY